MDTLGEDAHTLFLESREVKIKQHECRNSGSLGQDSMTWLIFSWAGPGRFPFSGFAQKIPVRADSPPREEGWPRHKKKVPFPKTARTGWSLRHPLSKRIREMELVSDHPEGVNELPGHCVPLLEQEGNTLSCNSFTPSPSAALRWLRSFLSMPQPPLLTRRGICRSCALFTTDKPIDFGRIWCRI